MLRLSAGSRRFGQRVIFTDLDLDLPAGDRLLVGGPNGSGKTTLLRCLAGTLTLDRGEVTIAGHPVGSLPARRLTGSCLNPEQSLYARLSGRDNLRLVATLRLSGRAAAEAVADVEREFEVDGVGGVPVERCSTGTRARFTLARALLGDPAVLLLDEPGRSLDGRARELLWAALDRRPWLTCVIASHDPQDRAHCHHTLTLPARR